jgi:hypothetical protein
MSALNTGTIVLAGSVAPGTVGGFVSNFTINTAVQALMRGKITDQMLLTNLASAAGGTLAANLESGIDKAFKAGEMTAGEAFAARGFAKVLISAVKALGDPDDPNYGFASAFINDLMPAPEQNQANGPVTQTAFDDDGNLMPGIVNPQASPDQQRTQLANQLRNQGMSLAVAHLMAQQALGGDVAPPSSAPTPTANAPAGTSSTPDQRITITGRALPQDAYGNRYEMTPGNFGVGNFGVKS